MCLYYSATYRDVLLETFVKPHPTAHGKTAADLGILQRYAPGVLVFGAEYCGPCKAEPLHHW